MSFIYLKKWSTIMKFPFENPFEASHLSPHTGTEIGHYLFHTGREGFEREKLNLSHRKTILSASQINYIHDFLGR